MVKLKTWQELHDEAYAEGRLKALVEDVLTMLRVRGIAVPTAARRRIAASKDVQQLRCWLRRAVLAASIDEVFDDKRQRPRPGRCASAR